MGHSANLWPRPSSADILANLTELHARWRRTGKARDLYRFLQRLLEIYGRWKRRRIDHERACACARLAGFKCPASRHSVRILIDCISKEDRRTKSRWVRALRFGWFSRKQYKSLRHCLRANGGVAGAASEWAALQAATRTPAGCVRAGGEHRVPKIPFFVDVALIDRWGEMIVDK